MAAVVGGAFPLDLLRQPQEGWKVLGFQSPLEGDWRSVYGHELKLQFSLDQGELLAFNYVYFPATSPQSGEVWVDGALETRDHGGAQGYFWRDFSAGPHTVSFIFKNLRSPNAVPGDPRPLSVAFTRLDVAPMSFQAAGQWTTSLVAAASFLCLCLTVVVAWMLGLSPNRHAH